MTNNIIKDLEADHQKILAFVNELEQRLIEFMEANIFDYEQMKRDILFIRLPFYCKMERERGVELVHVLLKFNTLSVLPSPSSLSL